VAGGKGRSMGLEGLGHRWGRDLPEEDGFRFFPGYYRHVIDTMARIPTGTTATG
jgi:15-cis-phytoene desaturase